MTYCKGPPPKCETRIQPQYTLLLTVNPLVVIGPLIWMKSWLMKFAPPKTNIGPEHRPSQKEISFSNHPFSGAMLVSGLYIFEDYIFSRKYMILNFISWFVGWKSISGIIK